MRKCIYCHRKIKQGETFIALYDGETQYIYYFCSWWHVIRWYAKRRWHHVSSRE